VLRRIFRTIVSGYQVVETGCSRIAAGIIMVLMFLTTADVIGRYVFNSPIQGAYDASEVMMVGVVFLGIAYVQSMKGHVKVEVITSWLPQRAQLGLDAFGYLVGFCLMALITWYSAGYAWKAWVTQDHTLGIVEIPFWPGKSLIPFGSGLLCLRLLSDVVTNFARVFQSAAKINKGQKQN